MVLLGVGKAIICAARRLLPNFNHGPAKQNFKLYFASSVIIRLNYSHVSNPQYRKAIILHAYNVAE